VTGHLVLSTVHTNDAASAVTRLVDLGLAPYMVASSLIGVVSMRLVRLLCPKCKDGYAPLPETLRSVGLPGSEARDLVFYRPVGCEHCNETGFRGRTGVYELLEVDEMIRRLVSGGGTESMIRSAAVEAGMAVIGQDGLSKVLAGETTLEEVQRVVYTEEESGRVCSACLETISTEYTFCPHCGTRAALTCEGCGHRVVDDWGFCPGCGRRQGGALEPETIPDALVQEVPRKAPARRAERIPVDVTPEGTRRKA